MKVWQMSKKAKSILKDKLLKAFIEWCIVEFDIYLYPYQIEMTDNIFTALFVTNEDVFIKCARQAGKTETLTLIARFLIVNFIRLFGEPFMCGVSSPKGEQAKTDIDRIKKALSLKKENWSIEDRENNAQTIRAYIRDRLACEMFKFSLMPTSANESKTLNFLIVEESHKADHVKRADELDPMLASTNGITVHLGVGCTIESDYRKGCDGEMLNSRNLIIDVDRIMKERRAAYNETKDPRHLNYEKKYKRDVKKFGRSNPEIRRNYHMEDMVEVGNFISQKRLYSLRRDSGIVIPTEELYLGIDIAKKHDKTVLTLINNQFDIVKWYVYEKMRYLDQVDMIDEDLKRDGFLDSVYGVRFDATREEAAFEAFMERSSLPVGEESCVIFSVKSKHIMYTALDQVIFTEDKQRKLSYPIDNKHTEMFEHEMQELEREYKGDGEYLCPHHPDKEGSHDDFPDSLALAVYAGVGSTLSGTITTLQDE